MSSVHLSTGRLKTSLSLAVVALVLVTNFLPTLRVNAAWADNLQAGGDRLTALQNNDGGWDWPLNDGNPANTSPLNTLGPIAMGLAQAYLVTGDANHLAALQDAGALLLSKTNNFSPSDGYLAAQLDGIFGGTTYVNHVNTNFYGPLAAGTYNRNGAGTLYSTASYVNLIRTSRSGVSANLAAWDIGMGLVGAVSAGADSTEWISGLKAEINELDGSGATYYDVIGLAGAVYGLAFIGEDFNPTSGQHASAASLADLAAILASYQLSTGGFTWTATANTINSDEAVQETAYAVLALHQFDPTTYFDVIQNATAYLRSAQLGTGGWSNYIGGGENNEVTGEALWAITFETVIVPEVVYETYTVPANGATLTTGPIQITIEFNQDVLADGSAAAANNVTNYLLVEAGLNGSFDTASCAEPGRGAAAPDDVLITIDAASYDGADPFITTLDINGGVPLPFGIYRLFICGTTSIENLTGLELNDGEADSILDFTIEEDNETAPTTLPATGFALGTVTRLPEQPSSKVYSNTTLILEIPVLDQRMEIVGIPQSGGGWDTTWLGQSAGWLQGSAFPTLEGNTVLTGHVWDNNNHPGPFANLKSLKYGDQIKIIAWGETYTYEIRESKVVIPSQVSKVFKHETLDWVTLMTCEAYNPFGDNYLFRRVVRAVLISVE